MLRVIAVKDVFLVADASVKAVVGGWVRRRGAGMQEGGLFICVDEAAHAMLLAFNRGRRVCAAGKGASGWLLGGLCFGQARLGRHGRRTSSAPRKQGSHRLENQLSAMAKR